MPPVPPHFPTSPLSRPPIEFKDADAISVFLKFIQCPEPGLAILPCSSEGCPNKLEERASHVPYTSLREKKAEVLETLTDKLRTGLTGWVGVILGDPAEATQYFIGCYCPDCLYQGGIKNSWARTYSHYWLRPLTTFVSDGKTWRTRQVYGNEIHRGLHFDPEPTGLLSNLSCLADAIERQVQPGAPSYRFACRCGECGLVEKGEAYDEECGDSQGKVYRWLLVHSLATQGWRGLLHLEGGDDNIFGYWKYQGVRCKICLENIAEERNGLIRSDYMYAENRGSWQEMKYLGQPDPVPFDNSTAEEVPDDAPKLDPPSGQKSYQYQVDVPPAPLLVTNDQAMKDVLGLLEDCTATTFTLSCVRCAASLTAASLDCWAFVSNVYKLGWRPQGSHPLYGVLCDVCSCGDEE